VDGEDADMDRAGDELRLLRDTLPAGVILVAGGRRSSRVTPDGVTLVEDLDGLRNVLAAAGPPEREAS
jgi:hypothetical protein